MTGGQDAGSDGAATEILILDDEVDVAQEIADGLRDEGYRCMLAARGEDALGLIDAQPGRFAVLVSDIRMPGLDGVGLARRLLDPGRTHRPGIVLMTGHAVPDEITTAFPAGAVQVIRKPFRWEEFLGSVATARDRARAGPSGDA